MKKRALPSSSSRSSAFSPYSIDELGKCPICNETVPLYRVNAHLDLKECGQQAKKSRVGKYPQGLRLIENFISEAEEQTLLEHLRREEAAWATTTRNGERLSVFYGVDFDITTGQSQPGEPLPSFVQFLLDRIRLTNGLEGSAVPNHLHVNWYVRDRGHYIRPHVDHRAAGGDEILVVSLLGDAVMELRRESNASDVVLVDLPRRSLEVMAKESRYKWLHSIPNSHLKHPERISLVFRHITARW